MASIRRLALRSRAAAPMARAPLSRIRWMHSDSRISVHSPSRSPRASRSCHPMNRFWIRRAVFGAALVGIAGCDLAVPTPTNPETARVIATPADLEPLLGTYYKRWHSALYNNTNSVALMAMVQSFEDFSSLSNNCMGQRVTIPRPPNDNSIGNGCGGEQLKIYQVENEVNRVASSVLARFNDPAFSLGSGAHAGRACGRRLDGGHCGCPKRVLGESRQRHQHDERAIQRAPQPVVLVRHVSPDVALHRRHGRYVGFICRMDR